LYLFTFSFCGLLFVLSFQLLFADLQLLAQKIAVQSNWMLPPRLQGGMLEQALVGWIPTPNKLLEEITSQRQLAMTVLLGFTQGVGGLVSGAVIIFFLSIYWSINQNHFERLWLSLLPAEQRKYARDIWRTIEHDLGAYIRSELIQSLLAMLLLGVGYWLLGSPYPALMAMIGALSWLVPVVGAALAVVLPWILALLTGAELSVVTVLYTVLVLIALQVWVEPRLFKLKWDNPILTFVILLVMANAFGLLGIIAAPPLSVVCLILWNLLVRERMTPDTAAQVVDLRERQLHLQLAIKEMDGPPPPLVVSSMERLTNLLERAEPILQAALPPEQPSVFHPSQPVTDENMPSEQEKSK
jgi:predicted PurR-regulated permease PerM